MSGGHFNGCGYVYYQVQQFADELENEIENNYREDEYGYAPRLEEQTIALLKEQLPLLRRASQIMREIDYLYSGDHGEDSFVRAIERAPKL